MKLDQCCPLWNEEKVVSSIQSKARMSKPFLNHLCVSLLVQRMHLICRYIEFNVYYFMIELVAYWESLLCLFYPNILGNGTTKLSHVWSKVIPEASSSLDVRTREGNWCWESSKDSPSLLGSLSHSWWVRSSLLSNRKRNERTCYILLLLKFQ